ncbi:MAG: response regulator [Deltaproteobacteria bacterium]|nr:response regulator [Deltaproteobacteria bacterium]MBW2070568.1 response regulator [Deltaproteobacteria bacterium]
MQAAEQAEIILVVDDERVVREGCSRILTPEGYQVLTAVNGKEALDLLPANPVNLLLCDLKMPVLGAIEVLEETTQTYPDIPVIIITGHGTVESAVECMKKGAYDFITKPFRADHLVLLVKRALEKQALEREARRLQEERARNLYDLAMEQSRSRTIVACMADGVLVTNRNLEVVLHNPAAMRLLGFTPPATPTAMLSHFIDDEQLTEALRLLLQEQQQEDEYIVQELERAQTHLRALSGLVYGPEREVLGTVTVFHDITSLKELDEMKSRFVQQVSHELRSPLAAIKQQHSVILEGMAGELTAKQRELLQRGHDKIQGLLDMINELLDVARIESGHAVQQQIPLQLNGIIKETCTLLAERAREQGVEIELSLPEEMPMVQADERCMEEVFINLVANAINYSPEGGKVSLSAVDHGEYLELRLTDTGIGIAPEELPKIFDKFYRVKHPKTRQVIGTGLGLAIVKGIIEAHRGSIEVESTPGQGTTFRIMLPTISGDDTIGCN